jgi:hypothetical protein
LNGNDVIKIIGWLPHCEFEIGARSVDALKKNIFCTKASVLYPIGGYRRFGGVK